MAFWLWSTFTSMCLRDLMQFWPEWHVLVAQLGWKHQQMRSLNIEMHGNYLTFLIFNFKVVCSLPKIINIICYSQPWTVLIWCICKCRYISSVEACWRIFKFRLHSEEPSIVRLVVHLENEQNIVFSENDTTEEILLQRVATTLTEWFAINVCDPMARQYKYHEFP